MSCHEICLLGAFLDGLDVSKKGNISLYYQHGTPNEQDHKKLTAVLQLLWHTKTYISWKGLNNADRHAKAKGYARGFFALKYTWFANEWFDLLLIVPTLECIIFLLIKIKRFSDARNNPAILMSV